MRNGLGPWALGWSLLGCAGFALLPWYSVGDGVVGWGWIGRVLSDPDVAAGLVAAFLFRRLWLCGPAVILRASVIGSLAGGDRALLGRRLLLLGGAGFLYIAAQAFAVGRQPGMGAGAVLVTASALVLCWLVRAGPRCARFLQGRSVHRGRDRARGGAGRALHVLSPGANPGQRRPGKR